jgi:mono/diheme cytochrome c family protein
MLRGIIIGAAALTVSLGCTTALAQGLVEPPGGASSVWDTTRGGELYDEWWAVIEADEPAETHPAYPAEGKKSGATTWRCKECHGWDYRGKDGAYGSGSHYTGIVGIDRMKDAPVNNIIRILRDETHGYTPEMLSDIAVQKLALFVSQGQIDTDLYIDRGTKLARGDAANGARYFQTVCAVCHGYDGKNMNFGDEDEPEYVGTVASDNPWEALHKIRFGQPGVGMVALGALDIETLVDILTYAQHLPTK